MKWIIILIIINLQVHASDFTSREHLFCSFEEAGKLRDTYEPSDLTDKSKHCLISCITAKRCTRYGIWTIGLLKEFSDIFTDGNPEVADLKANMYGINISRLIKSEKQCDRPCMKRYEPNYER